MPASRISPVPSGRSCAAVLLTPARYSEQLAVVPRSPGTTVNCSAAVPAVAPGLQGAHEGGVTLAAAAAQRGRAELAAEVLRLLAAGDDHGGGAVGDLRRVAGGDGAVLRERRLQLAQRLRGGARADAFVGVDQDRLALALRNAHRRDLGGEAALLDGGGRPLVALGRELVLGLPGEATEV